MAAGVASSLGLEVVDVVFRRQGKYSLLRIDIDRAGLPGVSLDDCERASHEIEGEIDAAGLIGDSYDLQVSSPGIDRPIATDDDFRRNTGRRIVIEATEEIDGTRVFRGVLRGLEGEAVILEARAGDGIALPRRQILAARQDVEADLHETPDGPRPRRRRDRRGIFGGSSS